MWERLTAPEDGFSKLQRENLAIIESYGKALMEVVCRDACDGHEISRVRAVHGRSMSLILGGRFRQSLVDQNTHLSLSHCFTHQYILNYMALTSTLYLLAL